MDFLFSQFPVVLAGFVLSLTLLWLCDRGDGLDAQLVFGFGLVRSCSMLCAGAAVEPFVSGRFYGAVTLSSHLQVLA